MKNRREKFIKLFLEIRSSINNSEECKVYAKNNGDDYVETTVNDEPTIEVGEYLEIYDLSDVDYFELINCFLKRKHCDNILDFLYHLGVYISETKVNNGEDIEGDIILVWSWEKYVGYCRNFHNLRLGNYNETESDLSFNESVFKTNESVLFKKKEIEGLDKEEIFDLICDELYQDHYKWSYFKNCLSQSKIKEFIDNNF